MNLMLTSVAFAIGAICAGLMGFAIQRGATCTVAAMDEVVNRRKAARLASMFVASLWVLGSLLIAQVLHVLPSMPAGYAVSVATILGGALLGIGALVNGACVFGAIARLGSGEWAYLLTPLGFYLGCLTFGPIFSLPEQEKLPFGSPVLQASGWVAILAAAIMAWPLCRPLFATSPGASGTTLFGRLREALSTRIWTPRAATTVIGATFFFLLVLAGAWTYTDVLAELARGMANNLVARILLAFALLAGAVIGGATAGRFRHTPPSAAQAVKCVAGGALMGWGSLMIPGGNDGLILVGMPLLWPYAWVAFLTMCLSIGVGMLVRNTVNRRVVEHGIH